MTGRILLSGRPAHQICPGSTMVTALAESVQHTAALQVGGCARGLHRHSEARHLSHGGVPASRGRDQPGRGPLDRSDRQLPVGQTSQALDQGIRSPSGQTPPGQLKPKSVDGCGDTRTSRAMHRVAVIRVRTRRFGARLGRFGAKRRPGVSKPRSGYLARYAVARWRMSRTITRCAVSWISHSTRHSRPTRAE